MRVFFTSQPERVPVGILDFGLLAVDRVFIGLDLARVCGVPGVWSFCDEPAWITGGQAFAGGQNFASVVAWDTVAGLPLVPVLESKVELEEYAPTSSSGALCCGGMLSHWPRPHRNGRQGVD